MATINANIGISYQNLASGKTITVTSAQTGYPGSNLNEPRLLTRHRGNAAALTSFNYDVDLSSNQLFELIALLGVNYSDTATRTIKADDTAGFGSPTLDVTSGNVFDTTYAPLISDTPTAGRHLLHFFDTPAASRYTRVTVTDTSNADNFLQAGVYWVGKVWQIAATGVNFVTWEAEQIATGEPGLERVVRRHKFTFPYLSELEARQLTSLYAALKRTGRIVVCPRTQSASTWIQHCLYCTIEEAIAIRPVNPTMTEWSASLVVNEVLD